MGSNGNGNEAYNLDVAMTPAGLQEKDCWLVVDVLRASSQMVTFFAMGGQVMVPARTPEEALKLKKDLRGDWTLMGERGGLRIDGFDFGNSPSALSRAKLGRMDKAIITTTNGTKALLESEMCGRHVLVACGLNAQKAAEEAFELGSRIGIVCSGEQGSAAIEDVACAGLLLEKMMVLAKRRGVKELVLTDAARIALMVWGHYGKSFRKGVVDSHHAQELLGLGMQDDIEFCAAVDTMPYVPKLGSWMALPALLLCE